MEFRQLGLARTFQSEVVTEVLRDRVGFVWIGTREGLFLHDGQRFRKFEHSVQDDGSMSSNGIRSLLEDREGRLWVATITGGLNLLDRAHWRFTHWRTGNGDRGPSHDGVFALAEAEGGRLWVGTQAGLDLFDPKTGRFRAVPLDKGGEFVMALYRDRRGRWWVATLGLGLYRSDDQGRSFRRIPRAGGGVETDDVFAVAEDVDGQIWVGTRDGLMVVSADGRELQAATLTPGATGDTLTNVTEIEPTPDGGLWVGTFGVGVYRVDPTRKKIAYVPLGIEGPDGQHVDQGAMALDAHGGLFVGTFGGGLLRVRAPSLAIRQWSEQGADGERLASEDVYVVAPDGAGGAWLGSFGGGVDHLLPSGKVVPLALPKGVEAGVINGVLDIRAESDGTLWAATSGGVYRFNPRTGAFRHYLHKAAATNYSYSMLRDREGRLWVGTGGGGLMLHRAADDTFALFRPDAADARSLSSDFITVLMEDRRGRLWVGTRSGGANVCTLRDMRLDCERVAARGEGHALSHDHVSALLEAPDGSVLVGTAGGGLDRLTLDAAGSVSGVARLSRSDGLMDDMVMALAYAPDGALWVSTRGGFSRIEDNGKRIDNYGPVDGLPTTVFNPKAVATIDGRLYWGTQQGVLAMDPGVRPPRHAPPPTVIASIDGLPIDRQPATPAWNTRALDVPLGQPFSLEFAVLGYDGGDPEYQYRLGDDAAWTGLDDRGQLTLHALAPGNYDLQVRGRRAGSAWTSAAPLQLSIVPPWWRQSAVQAVALLILLLSLLAAFGWRVRGLRRHNRELQRMQDQRGEALEALRRLTMRLEAAKEEERKHLARELHDEFGQALTAAKINLQLALVDPAAQGADARIADTVQLVDGLIAQVRALSFDLRPPLLDEMGLAPALEGHLTAVAHRTGVPIRVAIAPDLPPLGIEREIMVFRIVQEAVTNALRHAGASLLEVSVASTPDGIAINVRDDGRGFDTTKARNNGGGFGLFGMRERVHELGGGFFLESAPGQGTHVSALIPIEQGEVHARVAG
jgi:signal transduction histidine kinase/ligand-binding sensor domain-containing protein